MVTVSSPPPQLSSDPLTEDEVGVAGMDGLLEKLKSNMVELILQGDDVTRQMWHMYSVFEEIFGRQTMTTSSNQPLKHVVVGDRLKGSTAGSPKGKAPTERTSPTSPPPSSSPVSKVPTTTAVTPPTAATALSSPTSSTISASSPKEAKTASPESNRSSTSPPKIKVPKRPSAQSSSSSPDRPSTDEGSSQVPPPLQPPLANPLLDTIGSALATSNPDSDDSDLDIVYQQLRYRGRQQRKDQVRIRTHRAHQQVASSDPESIGYAGSNSIDSGYKSLCATPEVSDSLSAPEVRRSASDVSASDSSTTSGRPRSLDGGGAAGEGPGATKSKIRMGTRSIHKGSPRHVSAMNDVTLDHLMYLRQSLRKERSDLQRSPSESLPSSSGTFRDNDPSPRGEEDWLPDRPRSSPFRGGSPHSSAEGRSSSRGGEEIEQEGGGEGSSDFLLSGVEYYDLESIHEFPPNSYVTVMDDKTRCSRFPHAPASKCKSHHGDGGHPSSLYRKRSESLDDDLDRSQAEHIYGVAGAHPPRLRTAAKILTSRHHRQHHATDSKLTEAAIRVLEMIEDFRMEEAMTRSGRLLPYRTTGQHQPPAQILPAASSNRSPSTGNLQQGVLPRYRRSGGVRTSRPASTGSLMEQDMDVRSMASAGSYAASAEHHVYEEITYDLVCERERGIPPPIPPERIVHRSRLLPVPPHLPRHSQNYLDPHLAAVVRSHKHRSSSVYSVLPHAHGRNSVDRFLEMEWHLAQERRDNLPPDFPV